MHNLDTLTVHAGEEKKKPYGALSMPIVQTSTYAFTDTADLIAFMEDKQAGRKPAHGEYGRYGNPAQSVAEQRLAILEGAEDALLLASGMAAITGTLLTFLSAGDHYIVTDDCYRRTRQFSQTFAARMGIECTIVPIDEPQTLEAAIRPNTKLIFTESPTNPFLRVVDLQALTAIAHAHNLLSIVDTTFGTPFNIQPISLGIDLVIHSATKYLGGHNDLLSGVVIGQKETIDQIRELQAMMGAIPDPHNTFLLLRGLKTLALRIERQNKSGQALAEFLEGHDHIKQVWYPGLTSHPDYETASRIMTGFGGVVSFELDTDAAGARRFIDALQIPYIGPSLGGVESIVEQPALMSHFGLSADERQCLGITDELVRYAAGIEATKDLIADIAQALTAI